MEKIYITGTGRCGTTFLIKLFSFLNFDTGYTKKNYHKNINDNCNSGMEKKYDDKFRIIKNPTIINNISIILNDPSIKIKVIIIPIRNYKLSALSRVKYKNNHGGLWNAIDEKTQIQFYNKIISNYIYYMVKYEINTIFLDFDKMIIDKKYLFDKLKFILHEKDINFELFCSAFDEASLTSKSKK